MRPTHVSLAVLVAAIWGLNFVIIDVGLDDFPPLLLSSLRYLLASLPLLLFRGRPPVAWRWVIAVGVVIGVVKFSLLFIGMDVGMPAGLASLVLQAQALFTVVFAAAVLRERLVASQVVGLAIAFAGLALVATGLQGAATPEGFVLVIAAAAAWGVGNLLIKRAAPPGPRAAPSDPRAAPPDPLRFMSWICVVPPLPLLCLSLAFEGPSAVGSALAHVDLGGVGAVLYLAFAATTVGWALWARLMGLYPASTVAPFALLVPIFGLGFAAALRGEPIGARELIAAVLVLGGVLLTLLAPKPVRREAISPQLAGTS